MAVNKTIRVDDRMQKRFTYKLTEPEGKNLDSRFKPDLTPKQLLALGVFGGVYMRDCRDEFPADWFTKARFQIEGRVKRDSKLNFFGVHASQSLSVWRANGWIHKDDPRGWFQWYCRYYRGRRLPQEDERQIKRWVAMRRHVSQVVNSCRAEDFSCHTKQRQALLHWAYDSRKL